MPKGKGYKHLGSKKGPTGPAQKSLRQQKKERKKDKRKKNATFEGPGKNSGSDMRLAKNKERRSI